MRDIAAAREEIDFQCLKPIARHFKSKHGCDPRHLRIRGIDRICTNIRGGEINKKLAQCEARWIWKLKTMQPKGLNEILSFAPFLEQ